MFYAHRACPSIATRCAASICDLKYRRRGQKVEATGRRVRYLNIGDPIQFGFKTPAHLVAAVERAMRDGHNGYVPSAGIEPARRAVADEYTKRGVPVTPDRVVVTSGTSEGIDLALSTLADAGDEVLVPTPTYPLYTAILAKLGARPALPHRSECRLAAGPDQLRRLVNPKTRAIVGRSEQPHGRDSPRGDQTRLGRSGDRTGVLILADEVYADGLRGPAPLEFLDAPITFVAVQGPLVPGWHSWLVVGRSDRMNDAWRASQDGRGRLCSPGPMAGYRTRADRGSLYQWSCSCAKLRAELTTPDHRNPRHALCDASRSVLRHAESRSAA
jgi:alanine-synthesizing transaminase